MAFGPTGLSLNSCKLYQRALTACDVTLRRCARPSAPEQRGSIQVRSCSVMGQTEEVANSSSPWTGEEPHWLMSAWGDTAAPFKPSSRSGIATSDAVAVT